MHHHPPFEADRLATIDHAARIEAARAERRRRDPETVRTLPFSPRWRRLSAIGFAFVLAVLGVLTATGAIISDAATDDAPIMPEFAPHRPLVGTPPMYE